VNLIEVAKQVVSSVCETPTVPEFKFELTMTAAKKNYLMLGEYNLDLATAIAANHSSPMGYGSEFRKPDVLRPLLSMHPLWLKLEDILTNGAQYPLEPLEEELRVKDLELALEFGNHKGASIKPDDLLVELVTKDITYGYGIVLPLKQITKIPGVIMAPMNISPQNTIDETGRIVPKDRLT
jgi:hypothetical protein